MGNKIELHLQEKENGYLAFGLPPELKEDWKAVFGPLEYISLLEGGHCWLHSSLLEEIAKLRNKSKEVCYFLTLEDPRKRKVGGIGTYSENLPPELDRRLNLAILTHRNDFPIEKEASVPVVELDTLFSGRMLSPYGPEARDYWEFECRFGLKAAKFLLLQVADRVFVHHENGDVEEIRGLKMRKLRLILNDFQVFLPGILCCGFLGVKCTFVWHSVYRNGNDEKRAFLEEAARSLGSRKNVSLLTVSVDDLDFLSRGLDRKVSLLPNGVPLEEIRTLIGEPGLKRTFDSLLARLDCEGMRVLLYLGRYEEYKGIYELLEAAKGLLYSGEFVLIYAFPMEDVREAEGDLGERARSLGIPDGKLKVIGYLEKREVAALMHFSTLLAVPSKREPFGIIVLEGLAHEALVVGTRVGWIPELLKDAGFLAEPGDVASLSHALEEAAAAAADPESRAARIKKGNRVVEGYTWKKVAKEVLKAVK